jgi:hypothetical protein
MNSFPCAGTPEGAYYCRRDLSMIWLLSAGIVLRCENRHTKTSYLVCSFPMHMRTAGLLYSARAGLIFMAAKVRASMLTG